MAYRVLFAIGLLLLAGSVGLGAATSLRESGRLPAPSLSAVQVEGVSRERSMSDEWLAQMENLAAIQPRSISAWRALCISHKRRQERDEAVVACRRAIALGDHSGHSDRALARVYLDLGQERLARVHAQRASDKGLGLSPRLRGLLGEGAPS